jgi:uncharacterized protein (TIGR02996 family)
MNEHEPFIAAIEAQPDDHTARLVYADWLDEREHPAGEYLRAELQLATLPEGSDRAPDLRAKLRALRPRIEPAWLARFDQPRVMLANPTPFPAAWWAINLPGIRDFDSTYHRFPFETLPPLSCPPFNGTFDWLPKDRRPPDGLEPEHEARYPDHLRRLTRHLTELGLTVPPDFARWMTDPSLWCIPSSTGCSLHRSWDAAVVEGLPGTRVLPFYIDSQGCLIWYLYLTPGGYSAVLSSSSFLCNPWHVPREDNPDAPLDQLDSSEEPVTLVFAAPSVEAFLYRWSLENTIWHKLVPPRYSFHDPTPFTPSEQAYVDFYRRPSIGGT